MKLLMVIPTLDENSPLHGFYPSWINELSKNFESMIVIALDLGKYKPLKNIEVYGLNSSKTAIGKFFLLQKILFKKMKEVDCVYTTQFPELPIYSYLAAKTFRKPMLMWRTHGTVNLRSRISYHLVDKVVTGSLRSWRYKREKVRIIGTAINTNIFKPKKHKNKKTKFLITDRIEATKGQLILLEALKNLNRKDIELTIIGSINDKEYFNKIKKISKKYNFPVNVIGPVNYKEISKYYQESDIYLNASTTGSFDKTVGEAMACKNIVVTSNETFIEVFENNNDLVVDRSSEEFTKKIKEVLNMKEKEKERIREELRNIIVKKNSITSWAKKIREECDLIKNA